MFCPKCRIEKMKHETAEGIEFERCGVCNGIYLDRGEMQALLSKKQGTAVDSLAFSPISEAMDDVESQCFKCNLPMVHTMVATIKADYCKNCGSVFLDQGELATLQLHIA